MGRTALNLRRSPSHPGQPIWLVPPIWLTVWFTVWLTVDMVAPSPPPPPLTARRAPQVLAYPRKDAFEVWFLLQEDGRTFAKEVVFSRVRCHRWPDNEAVLERLFCTVGPRRTDLPPSLLSS